MSSILLSTETVQLRTGESVTIRALSGRQVLKYYAIITSINNRADGVIPEVQALELSDKVTEFLIRESITSGGPDGYNQKWRHLDLEDMAIVLEAINNLNFPEGHEKKAVLMRQVLGSTFGKPRETSPPESNA